MGEVFIFGLIAVALVAWYLDLRHHQPILSILSFGLLAFATFLALFVSESFISVPPKVPETKPQFRLALKKPIVKPILKTQEKPIAAPVVQPEPLPEADSFVVETPNLNSAVRPRFTVAYSLRRLFGNTLINTPFAAEFQNLENLVAKGAWAEVEAARYSLFLRLVNRGTQAATDLEGAFDMLAGIALLEQNEAFPAVRKFKAAIKTYQNRSGDSVEIIRARIELASALFAAGEVAVEISENPSGLLLKNKSENLHELTLLYRVRALTALANKQSSLANVYFIEARKFASDLVATDPARARLLWILLES